MKLRSRIDVERSSRNAAESILEVPNCEVEIALEAQQHRAATASTEVAEMQEEWRDSVKVQAAEDTRADENTA